MATFDYPYRKSINITAWVLQILVSLILLAAAAYVLAIVTDDENSQYLEGYGGLFSSAAGFEIAITGLTIILDIAEMILIGRSRLPPGLYLTSAVIKTLIWGIMLILSLISLAGLSILFCAVLAVTSIVQLVYGAMLVHRKRRGTLRGGKYAAAVNPADAYHGAGGIETGYGAHQQQQPMYDGPAVPAAYGNNNDYYQPQAQGGNTEYKSPAAPPYAYGQQPQQQQQGPGSYELDNRQQYA